uniref:Uncharacterized protein n=1 Tax=Rhizophora mucronata TaxID=61149 RepID=A0A2P2P6R6_RHIMU
MLKLINTCLHILIKKFIRTRL